ncbi:MAG: helix-turn-helix transcriptional regulator [Armatimonadetes bacterium]|nr:helix-turn-helix transcriptional regulator [Armatimonadota bacterium]
MSQPSSSLTVEQLRALNNPVRLQILTSLRANGPATVGELAGRLALQEHLLFYHVKLMASCGLLRPIGTRPTSTKPVNVYAAKAPGTAAGLDYNDPGVREAVCRNVTTVMRTAAKEYEAAAARQPDAMDDKSAMMRVSIRIAPDCRDELNARMKALTTWLADQRDDNGEAFSLTMLLTPLS